MAKKRSRETLTPEITPLIDVVFLLLIFFMVSTVFKKDELALMLTLPTTEENKETKSKNKSYNIEVTTNEIAFNGKPTDIANLFNLLNQIQDKNSPIDLRIDKDVKYSRVISVLDKLKSLNLNNLALITEK